MFIPMLNICAKMNGLIVTALPCRATVASKAKDAGGRAALLAAADTAGKWDSSTRAGKSFLN